MFLVWEPLPSVRDGQGLVSSGIQGALATGRTFFMPRPVSRPWLCSFCPSVCLLPMCHSLSVSSVGVCPGGSGPGPCPLQVAASPAPTPPSVCAGLGWAWRLNTLSFLCFHLAVQRLPVILAQAGCQWDRSGFLTPSGLALVTVPRGRAASPSHLPRAGAGAPCLHRRVRVLHCHCSLLLTAALDCAGGSSLNPAPVSFSWVSFTL